MSPGVRKRELRTGYTTGTCAAAAAKGAAMTLLGLNPAEVDIILPPGPHAIIPLRECWIEHGTAYGTVVKDAGDDPDVTNGAVIGAGLTFIAAPRKMSAGSIPIILKGGAGVGLVTKPGLPVKKGDPAINPVPRRMIRRAVREVFAGEKKRARSFRGVEVTIFVPDGEELAQKTFNPRLGILGGISILGTTGIVKPFSHQAYKETIACAMSIARASQCAEVVLSTGGLSERFARARLPLLREESFIQMGDYIGFSLARALSQGFHRVTVAAFAGKLTKIAAGSSCTHAGSFPLEISFVVSLGERLHLKRGLLREIARSVTVRGILEILLRQHEYSLIDAICRESLRQLQVMSGGRGDISVVLFSFDGRVLWYGDEEGKREGIG